MALQPAVQSNIKQFIGSLDSSSATNTYSTGISWTKYAFVTMELWNQAVPEIADQVGWTLAKDGTLTITKPTATWGATAQFKLTVMSE